MFRGKAEAGADRAEILLGKDIALGSILNHIKRASEDGISLFTFFPVVMWSAECLPGILNAIDQFFKFVGLQREGSIWSTVGAPSSNVFLDHHGAVGNRGNGHRSTQRMVGKPDHNVQLFREIGNGG